MNQEFKIISIFSKLLDFLVLNFLFVITSLPVITLGASVTALYSVTLKMVRNEESYIIRNYFQAFKRNFKIATLSFLLFLLAFSVLGMNITISYQVSGMFFMILRAVATIFIACLFVYAKYYFPILARFDFTFKQVWLHIPHMIVTHAGDFFFLTLLNIPVIILSLYSLYTAVFVIVIGCILGFSVFAYIESVLFRRIFQNYEIDLSEKNGTA